MNSVSLVLERKTLRAEYVCDDPLSLPETLPKVEL